MVPRVRSLIAIVSAAVAVAGCGPDDEPAYEPPALVHVIADEAIRQPMVYLGNRWREMRDDRAVFVFGPSPDMVEHARTQENADVLVTDDRALMDRAKTDGLLAGDPVPIAVNRIVLGVPTASPITDLSGLDGTRWIECTADTTCGRITDALQTANDFEGEPYQRLAPMEILGRVTSGRASAGFMWASEAQEAAAGSLVRTVEVPGAENQTVTYLIAPLARSADPDAARAFVELTTSDEGKRLIRQGKFALP